MRMSPTSMTEAARVETNYFNEASNLVSVSFRPDHSFIDDDKGH